MKLTLALLALLVTLFTSADATSEPCMTMSKSGKCCVFPFLYKGKKYNSCTSVDEPRPWCALTNVYKKGHWDWCVIAPKCETKTTKGQCCVFPFTYHGKVYHSCTSVGEPRPWCALTSIYKKGQWGWCKQEECKGIADIGFVVDSSGSLGGHYKDEKDFVKGLARSFGISKDGSHAGVITFSLRAKLNIRLNQYMTQDSFDTAVDNMPHLNAFTRIDLGLKLAKNELFMRARPHVAKICVLITDGSQTQTGDAEDPAKIAAQLRANGVKTISVGIGSEVKVAELAKIAGNAKDVYTAANFDILKSPKFANGVKQSMCTNHN